MSTASQNTTQQQSSQSSIESNSTIRENTSSTQPFQIAYNDSLTPNPMINDDDDDDKVKKSSQESDTTGQTSGLIDFLSCYVRISKCEVDRYLRSASSTAKPDLNEQMEELREERECNSQKENHDSDLEGTNVATSAGGVNLYWNDHSSSNATIQTDSPRLAHEESQSEEKY